jgi:hypothetical protein
VDFSARKSEVCLAASPEGPGLASPTKTEEKSYISGDFSTMKDMEARQILEEWKKRGRNKGEKLLESQ